MRRVGTQDKVLLQANAWDAGKAVFVGLMTPGTSEMKEIVPSKLLL